MKIIKYHVQKCRKHKQIRPAEAGRIDDLEFCHVTDALLADVLAAIADQLPAGRTEDAGRLEFLQNDSVALHVDLQLIPLRNVQRPAQFDGQHDAAQLIHLANDAS